MTHLLFISHKFSHSQINISKTLALTNLENLFAVTKVYEILAVLGMLLLDTEVGHFKKFVSKKNMVDCIINICLKPLCRVRFGIV